MFPAVNTLYNALVNDPTFKAVSYTHLDVYKRQAFDFFVASREPKALLSCLASSAAARGSPATERRPIHRADCLLYTSRCV